MLVASVLELVYFLAIRNEKIRKMYTVTSFILSALVLVFSVYFLVKSAQGAGEAPVEYQTFIMLLSYCFITLLPVTVHLSFNMIQVEEPVEQEEQEVVEENKE